MKFSKFNLIIKEGNKRVLFNTLSGECFKISTGVEEIIDNNRKCKIIRRIVLP